MSQCKSCGLLAIISLDGEPSEVGSVTRQTGEVPYTHHPDPVCSVWSKECQVERTAELYDNKDYFVRVVTREHNCPEFLPWRPGLKPREQLELELKKEQNAWQDNQNRLNRVWAMWIAAMSTLIGAIVGAATRLLW